jgi:hypothetical protein
VREYTNLGWPQTPFGADKRPFPRNVHLIAATAVQWADDGDRAVPIAAGLVYLPVQRAGTRLVSPETLHVGYRVAVLDDPAESPAVIDLIDGNLVQARRHAAALAVHCWLDDSAALRTWAAGDTPGISAVTAAWADRRIAERGIARVIETSADIQDGSISLPAASQRHGLSITHGVGGLLSPAEIQATYEQVFSDPDTQFSQVERDDTAEALGLSALYQGLLTALLAAEEIGRCTWNRPFPVDEVLADVAWDAFPRVLPTLSTAGATAG